MDNQSNPEAGIVTKVNRSRSASEYPDKLLRRGSGKFSRLPQAKARQMWDFAMYRSRKENGQMWTSAAHRLGSAAYGQ
jgi:hypothetical protein